MEFLCWLWDRNSLYWYQNIQIKFRTFWSQFLFFMQMSHMKLEIIKTEHQEQLWNVLEKTKQEQVWNIVEMHLMITSRRNLCDKLVITLVLVQYGVFFSSFIFLHLISLA